MLGVQRPSLTICGTTITRVIGPSCGVIAGEIKHHGDCDLSIEAIAARAGRLPHNRADDTA